jgi:hypothetical protein
MPKNFFNIFFYFKLEKWWLNWAYLEWRLPTAPFINTCGYLTDLEIDGDLKKEFSFYNVNLQLASTSNYLYNMCLFFNELRKYLYFYKDKVNYKMGICLLKKIPSIWESF